MLSLIFSPVFVMIRSVEHYLELCQPCKAIEIKCVAISYNMPGVSPLFYSDFLDYLNNVLIH